MSHRLSSRTLSLQMVKDNLAHAHGLGSYLHILVCLDILQSLFKGEDGGRDDTCLLICTAGTDIGQLLCLAHIDNKVDIVNMLTYNLTSIHLVLGFNEELATVLQVVYGIGIGIATFQRYELTVDSAVYLALERLVLLEAMRHYGLTL